MKLDGSLWKEGGESVCRRGEALEARKRPVDAGRRRMTKAAVSTTGWLLPAAGGASMAQQHRQCVSLAATARVSAGAQDGTQCSNVGGCDAQGGCNGTLGVDDDAANAGTHS